MIRIMIKSVECHKKLNLLMQKKTQNSKISDFEITKFEIVHYPTISEISDYRPAAVGKEENHAVVDEMVLIILSLLFGKTN